MSFLRNEHLTVSFLLAGILCSFFWRCMLLGESLLDSQLSINDPIYKELGIQTSPSLFFRPDPTHVLQDRPFILFSAETLASGYIPLWNPYQEGGTPFFASFIASPLFPLKWILYLSSPLTGYSYYVVLPLGLAGFFTHVFSRLIGLSRYGAFFAATTYMFCGFIISHLQYALATPVTLMPIIFTTFQRAFTQRDLPSILFASLSFHLILLAGHPTIAFVILGATSIYFIALTLVYIREDLQAGRFIHHIQHLGVVGLLGLLLSAVLLLPFFELLKDGYTYKEESHNAMLDFKRLGTDGIKSMAGLFLPHYKTVWFTSPQYRSNTYAYQAYCGIVALVLFAYALVTKPIHWPLMIVFLLSSGFAFGIAPFSALNFTFPFNYIPAEYGLIPLSFTLIVLSGQGLDKIFEDFKPSKFYGVILILSGIALNFFAGLSRPLDWTSSSWADWRSFQVSGSLFLISALLVRLLGPPSRANPRRLSVAFILLSCADLFYNGYWVNPPQPKFDYPETSPIRKLKSDESLYRILGMDGVSRLNTGMIHHLQDLQSYMTIIQRRHREFMILGDPQIASRIATATEVYDSPLWNLMNVKYILRRSDKPIPQEESFRLVYRDPYVLIYENLRAFPRAFIVPNVHVVEGKSQAFQALSDYKARLRNIAVIEAEEDREALEKAELLNSYERTRPPDPALPEGEVYNVKMDAYQLHRVVLTAELKAPGFLVLSDTIYPGWRVQVDGKEEKIYPTDYALRGVFLDKGAHSVVFYYQPTSFKLGLYLSALGSGLTALGFTVKSNFLRRAFVILRPPKNF